MIVTNYLKKHLDFLFKIGNVNETEQILSLADETINDFGLSVEQIGTKLYTSQKKAVLVERYGYDPIPLTDAFVNQMFDILDDKSLSKHDRLNSLLQLNFNDFRISKTNLQGNNFEQRFDQFKLNTQQFTAFNLYDYGTDIYTLFITCVYPKIVGINIQSFIQGVTNDLLPYKHVYWTIYPTAAIVAGTYLFDKSVKTYLYNGAVSDISEKFYITDTGQTLYAREYFYVANNNPNVSVVNQSKFELSGTGLPIFLGAPDELYFLNNVRVNRYTVTGFDFNEYMPQSFWNKLRFANSITIGEDFEFLEVDMQTEALDMFTNIRNLTINSINVKLVDINNPLFDLINLSLSGNSEQDNIDLLTKIVDKIYSGGTLILNGNALNLDQYILPVKELGWNVRRLVPYLYFDGENSVAKVAYFDNPLTVLTVEITAKCIAPSIADSGVLFQFGESGTTEFVKLVYFYDRIQVFAQAGASEAEHIIYQLDTNVEHKYLVSVDTLNRLVNVFVDGVLVMNIYEPTLDVIYGQYLHIGAGMDSLFSGYSKYFHGDLYEVSLSTTFISNYAQYAQEMKVLFKLNEGSGNVVYSYLNNTTLGMSIPNTIWRSRELPA